jgi:serine/threonine protein kinase
MPLSPGDQLGPYRIEAPIGEGGMGAVYKAKDTRLDRTVAIKISNEQFSERFEREARAIAQLNHPNICQLYDVGPNYLVMEFIEGTPLKNPLPLQEALKVAAQICDALDAAHRKKITHRDLKPGNILLTKSGQVKLLDFGLAKLTTPATENDETRTLPLTSMGTIVGTLPYMAPEQLEAKEVDARTDIFAFGAVLYELITGRRPFQADSQASLIGAILHTEAPPLAPPWLDRVVRRCLAKDADDRWQSARDLKAALLAPAPVETARPASKLPWIVAAAFALVACALAFVAFRHATEEPPVARLTMLPPEKSVFFQRSHPMVSPDGRRVTFVARTDNTTQLWIRDIDTLVARPLPGTSNSNDPFWSPDSRSIGFFADGKLKRIDVAGGPAQTVANASQGRGGSWNRDGVIVFTPGPSDPLYRVAAAGGGTPAPVTKRDVSTQENSHRLPWFLPDGRHFLYLVRAGNRGSSAIYAGDIESKQSKRILVAESNVMYVPPGLLLFVRESTLIAQLFDAARLETTGDPFPVAEQIDWDQGNSRGSFSVSQNGVLVYFAGAISNLVQLAWFDRGGKAMETVGPRGTIFGPALSPDGNTAALAVADPSTGNRDIWLYGLARGTANRFTFERSDASRPAWSPDGTQIAFVAARNGQRVLARKAANGAGAEEILLTLPASTVLSDWSRDGRFLIYFSTNAKGIEDIWSLPLSGDRKPVPYQVSAFSTVEPKLSPDGRWLAYQSSESGRPEVYVQSFPTPAGKFQISTAGAYSPRWSRDGKEIFYLSIDRKMMAVDVKAGAAFEPGTPKALFQTRALRFSPYDVSPNGRRFLIASYPEESAGAPLTVVLNWMAGIRK